MPDPLPSSPGTSSLPSPLYLVGPLVAGACIAYWVAYMPMPGRSAELVLWLGTLLGGLAVALRPGALLVGRDWWKRPWVWAGLALAWQTLALVGWGLVPVQGWIWTGERAAALAIALGVLALGAGRRRWAEQHIIAACLLTLALLLLPVLGRLKIDGRALGEILLVGREAPFGLPNFNAPAGLPFLALGLGLLAWHRRARTHAAVVFGVLAGLAGAKGMGLGLVGGDPAIAVWPTLAAIYAGLAVFSLPRRLQAPILVVGIIAVINLQLYVIATGWLPLDQPPPSMIFRIYLWRAAAEAAVLSPLVGYGPAGVLDVVNATPSYSVAWLAVPSFAEHAHHEFLQVLVDGGLVFAALLAACLATTLAPLWRHRRHPTARALLVAWMAWAAYAGLESHHMQPGPLLALGLLAGLSWGWSAGRLPPPRPEAPVWPVVLRTGIPLVAVATLVQLSTTIRASHAFRPNAMAGLEGLAIVEATEAQAAQPAPAAFSKLRIVNHIGRWAESHPRLRTGKLQAIRNLGEQIGPVDDLTRFLAHMLLLNDRQEEALAAIARQAERLPVDPVVHQLIAWYRDRLRLTRPQRQALQEALDRARAAARPALERIHDYGIDHKRSRALHRLLSAPATAAASR